MKAFYLFLVLAGPFLMPWAAQGRILNYKESLSAFSLNLHGAQVTAGSSVYGLDLPEEVHWDQGQSLAYGVEPGIFLHRDRLSLHVGVLLMLPAESKKVKGQAGSGALELKPEHNLFLPRALLQWDLRQFRTSRIYLGAGAGYATLKGKFQYEFSAPLAASWGQSQMEQRFESRALSKTYLIGAEKWLGGPTAIALEVGYRDLFFRKLKYSQATNIPSGAKGAGELLQRQGQGQGFHHGGFFATLSLKAYLSL